MSLKSRLLVSIVALVAAVVAALSAFHLYALAESQFDDAHERASISLQQIQELVVQRVDERAGAHLPPNNDPESTRAVWTEVISTDPVLHSLIESIRAHSKTVVDILITDASDRILASADPQRIGQFAEPLPELEAWKRLDLWRNLARILSHSSDYQVSATLSALPDDPPFFDVRVVVSSVIFRNEIVPHLRRLLTLSLMALLAAVGLSALIANVMLRPLARLSEAIDRISAGQSSLDSLSRYEAEEFAAVQVKLNLLGKQMLLAREDVSKLRGNIERMLQRLDEAVLLFDPDDRLVLAGRPAERLLGRDQADLLGRKLTEVFPPDSPIGSAVQRAVEFHQPLHDYPMEIPVGEGGTARLLLNVELLDHQSGAGRLATLVTLRDAETRTQLQTQLDVSTRLAAISRLTGGVAHEIKNPLNAIALHLEILRSKVGKDNASAEGEIEVIGREVARLDRVVKTFIEFTRPVELEMRPVNLAAIVNEVMQLLSSEMSRRRIVGEVRLPREPAVVLGDPEMLKQALLNVIVNGIEAMREGGRLELEIQRSYSDYLVTVADEGVGMPADVQDRVFHLFFTTKKSGSGVGLAVAFQVVQLHNGTIDFTSRPGQGTTFRLCFPVLDDKSRVTA